MSALGSRQRWEAALAFPPWSWLVLTATGAWTALVVGAHLGDVVVPHLNLVTYGVPALLVGTVALGRRPTAVPVKLAAGWALLLAVALYAAPYAIQRSPVLFAVPAVAIAGVLGRRWPLAFGGAAFLFTGIYNTFEAYTNLPSHRIVDLFLAALWVAVAWSYLFSGRRDPVLVWPGVALSTAYLGITLAQALVADPVEAGLSSFRASAWYMMAFLLLAYSGLGPARLRKLARVALVVAVVVGGYAVLRWIIGPSAREAASATDPTNLVNGELRPFGSFQAGHAMAAWMAPVVAFSLAAFVSTRGRWRVVALAAMALCTIALLASEVRSGLPALIAGCAVVLALFQLSRGFPGARLGITAAALVCAVGLTGVAFALTLSSDQARERYTVLATPGKDPSVQRRLQKWHDTLDAVRDEPFGLGLGASGKGLRFQRFRSLATSNLDNSYLKILYDQGIFVLVFFVGAVLLLMYGLAYRALATLDPAKAGVAIGACGALTAFLVMAGTGIYIEGLPALAVWMLVGIGVGQFTTLGRTPA